MKQFQEVDSRSNLDRYVCENYHLVDFDFVKPIIEKRWRIYMDIFGWSIDEILDAYRNTKSDIGGIVRFDYVPSSGDNEFVTKQGCAYILIRDNKGEVKQQVLCDQCVVAAPYFGTFSNKALKYFVVKRFPFLLELTKEDVKEMYLCNYLQEKKISEIPEEYRDRTLKELYSCYDKIEVTEVVDEFSIYFDEYKDNPYFFIDCSKLSFIVDFRALIDKDFDKIVEVDNKLQDMFVKRLTEEEKLERLNSRGMRMIREYCKSK